MSARTGRTESRESILSRFASLTGKATGFIEEGQRSPEMINALLTSLQMFRDNTLCMPETPRNPVTVTVPIWAQERLSFELSDRCIVLEDKIRDRFIKEFGILYVGELYRFSWAYGSHENHVQSIIRRNVEEMLKSLDLPPSLDLQEWNWKPEYDTSHLRTLLDKPFLSELREPRHENQANQWKNWNHWEFVGDLFNNPNPTSQYLKNLSAILRKGSEFRAGMYFPNWSRPKK
jgi:hypothetical protein